MQLAEYSWLAEFSFLVTGCCTKISVLLFYRRLVGGTYSRSWHWAVVGAILFTAAWSIALILTLFFNCTPTEAYWKVRSLLVTGGCGLDDADAFDLRYRLLTPTTATSTHAQIRHSSTF